MKITRLDRVERNIMGMEGARDTWKQVPIGKADAAPNFSFRVFTIAPGGYTPYHAHAFEHVNYVIEGSGAVVKADGEEQAVEKGDFLLILPNEKHRYRNTAKEQPLVIICAVPKEFE